MTQKSRDRKRRERIRNKLTAVVEGNETYSFYHGGQVVDVVAPSLEEAQQKFTFSYGYRPNQTVQEYLK